ncbi:hypothetical protein V513_08945 [Mesotoga sp. H07.pep.5.3]|nr:hypothetical protein V513_08945 [Mesotoga sp. H07.pep.5.3]
MDTERKCDSIAVGRTVVGGWKEQSETGSPLDGSPFSNENLLFVLEQGSVLSSWLKSKTTNKKC